VLGYIDPERFLGGDMPLDASAASAAIAEHVAGPLRLGTVEGAWGIFSIVNETMVAAARRYTAERAIDVRECTLVTFGGAAPLHAWEVARILGVREIVYPIGAGVTSAVGLCIATPVVNVARTVSGMVDQLDFAGVAAILEDMESRAQSMLASAGVAARDVRFSRSVDVRYKGQGYEIAVPVSGIELRSPDAAAVRGELARRFSEQYARAYGRVLGRADLEAVTWRIRAEAPDSEGSGSVKVAVTSGNEAPVAHRTIFFGPRLGFADTPVYDRYAVPVGASGVGPALMQERETTVVVPPNASWRIDAQMNLHVRLQGEPSDKTDDDARD
jgi:N-methylhydantoinase A